VRPVRLALEGFTSFRDRVEIDFSALDLFAVTGPTGAGKSSLVDAIVFALYGQVPRVGDDYKQLISHGAERLSVLLEFAVGDERYRVSRAARRTGASQQRLERLRGGRWEPLADRAREIRSAVERALGLDYDGFTRSVVLPQGQFDAFLKGEPKERRKILVALLGLGVYERMLQLANQKAAVARAGAERIRTQLDADYAGATPEALEARRAELAVGERAAQRAEAALAALAEGAALAQAARAARGEAESARRDEGAAAEALEAAVATLEGADTARVTLDAEIEDIRRRLESSAFDETRLTVLAGAKPLAKQLAGLAPSIEATAGAVLEKRRAESAARAGFGAVEAALPQAEKAESAARAEEARTRAEREAAHRLHAALALRRTLRPGEPCPVCAQDVRRVPPGEAPALDVADARAREAEAATRAAAARLQEERLRAGKLQAQAEALGREAAQLEEQEKEKRALAARLADELRRCGFAEAAPETAASVLARIQAEVCAVEAARCARTDLGARRQALERRRAGLEASLAAAAARRDTARARIEALRARREEGTERLEAARRTLLDQAAHEGWAGLAAPAAGKDEADVVEALREEAQRSSSAGAARVATLREAVVSAEKAVARVAELGAERVALEASAALHKTLADLLKADELVAWIQEEALRRLAEEGSRHLAKLSQGRYELRLGSGEEEKGAKAEQDFYVVDRWNADGVRSVRTLSGGETFLASLALALALAESMAQLAAEGRTAETLESLFLDEGFGTLDAETLDVVISALDALHGSRRMVGIVTHVPELAERLPARVEVRRAGAAAAAVVV
jgi:exonuclease SbcC